MHEVQDRRVVAEVLLPDRPFEPSPSATNALLIASPNRRRPDSRDIAKPNVFAFTRLLRHVRNSRVGCHVFSGRSERSFSSAKRWFSSIPIDDAASRRAASVSGDSSASADYSLSASGFGSPGAVPTSSCCAPVCNSSWSSGSWLMSSSDTRRRRIRQWRQRDRDRGNTRTVWDAGLGRRSNCRRSNSAFLVSRQAFLWTPGP